MIEIFDGSEWASILWIIIILIILFSYKPTKQSLSQVLKVIVSFKFIIIYVSAILYIIFWISLLYKVGFWEISLLKESLLWLLLGGSIMMYKIIEIKDVKSYFIVNLNEAFKWAVLIEFIIGLWSLNFWFEFFYIPISLILGLLIGFGEKDVKNIYVVRVIKTLVLFSGILIFVFKIYQLIVNYKSQLTIDNLKQFMLSPIFTLLFIPFLYILFLYVNYETIFLSLNRFLNPNIKSYVKLKMLWSFNVDITGLKRVRDELMKDGVFTKEKIKQSILEIKKLKKIERNPPIVNPIEGWSPYRVKDYLKGNGLETGFYNKCYDDDWNASSFYLKLDDAFLSNNLAYYINGTEKIANSCKLILNVNDILLREKAHEILLSNSKIIYLKIFGFDMPSQIISAIINGEPYEQTISLNTVSVSKNKWANGKGYHIAFEISHFNKVI